MTGEGTLKVKLRYLTRDRSRHGQIRLYVRRPGFPKIRLLVDRENDPAFAEAYAAAMRGEQWRPTRAKDQTASKITKALPGTFRALCQDYFAFLVDDTTVSERTKYTRRLQLETLCAMPVNPESPRLMGDVPIAKFGPAYVIAARDRKRKTPEAANSLVKAARALSTWALERKPDGENFCRDVKLIQSQSEGFATWSETEIAQFEARWPIGTKPRLALALILYTGVRRSDVVKLGRQHVRNGCFEFRPTKTARRKKGGLQAIPIIPALQSVIEQSQCGDLTFIVTEFGRPFTVAGFGNWFRDRCDEAGLKGRSAHGLRKALQTIGAEEGLTDRELMAIAGHESAKETTRYTRNRDRRALAASGMAKLAEGRFRNEIVPPENSFEKVGLNGPEIRSNTKAG